MDKLNWTEIRNRMSGHIISQGHIVTEDGDEGMPKGGKLGDESPLLIT